MVSALACKKILGRHPVDGWTRWVACAYIRVLKHKPETATHRRPVFNGSRNFDDVKANSERDWL